MRLLLKLTLIFLVVIAGLGALSVQALPQEGDYTRKKGFWYDNWGYVRDRAVINSRGFMPNLAYEGLGVWEGEAFNWGKRFMERYPLRSNRAEAILEFVQQWTEYGYDEDNVVIDGVPQEEWAWNSDEMFSEIDLNTNSRAIGDCEDLAFLCSAIYEGAGFDTAMVLTARHAALLIWLPEYPGVLKWDLEGDGRGYGWIWVESTGENNPLGWTPETFRDGLWEAYIIELMYIHDLRYEPKNPFKEDDVTVTASVLNKTSNLEKMTVKYSLGDTDYEVDMERLDGITYQATLPRQEEGTLVEFRVEARDHKGNRRESNPLSYRVGEAKPTILPPLLDLAQIATLLIVIIIVFKAL